MIFLCIPIEILIVFCYSLVSFVLAHKHSNPFAGPKCLHFQRKVSSFILTWSSFSNVACRIRTDQLMIIFLDLKTSTDNDHIIFITHNKMIIPYSAFEVMFWSYFLAFLCAHIILFWVFNLMITYFPAEATIQLNNQSTVRIYCGIYMLKFSCLLWTPI